MTTPKKTSCCLAVSEDKNIVLMVEKVVYWETDKVHMNQFVVEHDARRNLYILWVNDVSLAQAKKMETFANGVVAGYREARKNLVKVG